MLNNSNLMFAADSSTLSVFNITCFVLVGQYLRHLMPACSYGEMTQALAMPNNLIFGGIAIVTSKCECFSLGASQ